MKTRQFSFVLGAAAAAVFAVWLASRFIWHSAERRESASRQDPAAPTTMTNIGTSNVQPDGVAQTEPTRPPGMKVEAWESLIRLQRHFVKMNGPVVFHGKAVDQHRAAIRGVRLQLKLSSYNERALREKGILNSRENDFAKEEALVIESDANGRFLLSGKRGSGLYVEKVEKEGYLWHKTPDTAMDYNPTRVKSLPAYADPTKGMIFHLWKKGEPEPVVQMTARIRLEEDKTEYPLDIFSNLPVEIGSAAIDLWVKIPLAAPDEPGRPFDRWIVIEAPNGGILETQDVYPYSAPAEGFQREWRVLFQPGERTQVSEGWRRNFYLRTRDGRVYAGLMVRFDPGTNTIEIDSIINAQGSRHLEPDPAKLITDPEEIRRLDAKTRN